ncbi:MAG: hypothetical protein KME55_20750 [Nostoc indistinguendum CM1-VF10]|nr:hypothetical protein [Nostoc indistinguendum CM1-VF10]
MSRNTRRCGFRRLVESGEQGEIKEKNQCSMPNAQCPMPNAPFPTQHLTRAKRPATANVNQH